MSNRLWTLPSYQLERNVVRLYGRLVFGAVEVDQVTSAAKASITDGDYFVVHDWKGGAWAIAVSASGTLTSPPTGAAWTAIPTANKAYISVSSATTAANVSALVHTALVGLTGFTSVATAVTSSANQNITDTGAGVVTAPAVYSAAGAAGTGSFTASVTTAGTNNQIKDAKGFTTSVTQNSKGVYTITCGLTDPVTGRNSLDVYNHVLSVNFQWDGITSSAAPLAPLVYLTGNSVATATAASFQITCNNTSQAVANPALNELLRFELHVANGSAGWA